MTRQEFAESRDLTRVGGKSVGGTIPKDLAEEHDLLDENGEPNAEGTPYVDKERGVVGIEFSPTSE